MLLRITDPEVCKLLKTISFQGKEMGFRGHRGSFAGVILRFLKVHEDELREMAKTGKTPRKSNEANGPPSRRYTQSAGVPRNRMIHTIKLSIPEGSRRRNVVLRGKDRAAAEEEGFAYAWFVKLFRSRKAFESEDLRNVNYWRSVNSLDDTGIWPGWVDMAHLVCEAYLEHPHHISDWRDWVEN